jgi:hypothetical protein
MSPSIGKGGYRTIRELFFRNTFKTFLSSSLTKRLPPSGKEDTGKYANYAFAIRSRLSYQVPKLNMSPSIWKKGYRAIREQCFRITFKTFLSSSQTKHVSLHLEKSITGNTRTMLSQYVQDFPIKSPN